MIAVSSMNWGSKKFGEMCRKDAQITLWINFLFWFDKCNKCDAICWPI